MTSSTAKITILMPKLFNIGILQQIFKMSAVCRNTIMETLTPLLDSVVDNALVQLIKRNLVQRIFF